MCTMLNNTKEMQKYKAGYYIFNAENGCVYVGNKSPKQSGATLIDINEVLDHKFKNESETVYFKLSAKNKEQWILLKKELNLEEIVS